MVNNSNGLIAFTLIAEGNCVTGDVVSKSNIRINGEVIGSVKSEGKIVVGSKAHIDGCIEAADLFVEGSVKGIIHVKNNVHVKSAATLFGDLSCRQLILEPGAVFNGSCCMDTDRKKNRNATEV